MGTVLQHSAGPVMAVVVRPVFLQIFQPAGTRVEGRSVRLLAVMLLMTELEETGRWSNPGILCGLLWDCRSQQDSADAPV